MRQTTILVVVCRIRRVAESGGCPRLAKSRYYVDRPALLASLEHTNIGAGLGHVRSCTAVQRATLELDGRTSLLRWSWI
jgi:hypothetical protein